MAVEGMAELMILQYLSTVVPVHAVMAYRGGILNLGTRVMQAVNIML